MSKNTPTPRTILPTFQMVSNGKPERVQAQSTMPFSIRFTADERAYLEEQAGNLSLGTFAREQLLGAKAQKRRALRKPKVNDKNLALVMTLFGDQRIASNLNQLAKHANMGTLDFDDDVLEQILEACAAMIAIRNYLIGE